jgi:adenylate cyclase
MIKKILLSPWTALLTLFLIVGVRVSDPSFIESIRLRYFDTLITSKPTTENSIYTINIDESSLDKYGQWPFKRTIYADIIQNLYEHNAGLVVFNVLMPETDRQGGDKAFANALSSYPVILPNIPADLSKNTPKITGSVVLGPEFIDRVIQYPGIIANIPVIEESVAGVGTVNTLPEIDGVNRRMPLVVSVGDKLYPSLSLETVALASSGDSTFQVKLNEFGVEKMRIPKFGPITTDPLGRVWIDWSQSSTSISLSNIPDDLNGSIVIVGPTAAGIGNPIPTAKGSVFPHEAQAAVIGTIMNNVVIQRPDYADGVEILSLLVIGILLLFLTRWIYVGLGAVVVLTVGSVFGSQYVFSEYLYLFDITAFVSGIILVALHAYGVKFVSEFLQKMQIKKQFGSYVNPTIVEKLQKNPELIKLGGERKELSIVMTDLRGFTTLGESFGDDVEGLTQIMNDYMTALSVPVLKNDGTLIKFIGDASLHVHGAPLDDPNHAVTAVKTAQQMIKAIEDFNIELTASGRPPVGMGAGVNTGETLIGNIGSKDKFGYDVLGDSVSTAARLEGQTKSYGVLLIIGPNTNALVKDEIFTLELDNIAVKGKTVGLQIYTPLLTDNVNLDSYEEARTKHNFMLLAYRSQQFDQAIKMSKELMSEFDGQMEHSYELWIERCEQMKKTKLPLSWDGIYRATTK